MINKFKIVVTDRLAPPADIEQRVLGSDVAVVVLQATCEEQILEEVVDADALLVWHEVEITEKSLSRMKKCKIIVRVGAGFDNVDLKFAASKKIFVCNVPDYGTHDVADHAFSFILSIYRSMTEFIKRAQDYKNSWTWEGAQSKRLTGETLGIIGLGRIGTAVALRAKAFGLNVVFYDPYVKRGTEKSLGLIRKEGLKELLAESDIISFHTPLTDETRNMASNDFFNSLKAGVTIINTARGGIIDLDALYDALKKEKVRAAGLDVLSIEPPDQNNRLIRAWSNNEAWLRDRLLITPHCAFYSPEAFYEMREKAAKEVKRVLEGESPQNCVNRK